MVLNELVEALSSSSPLPHASVKVFTRLVESCEVKKMFAVLALLRLALVDQVCSILDLIFFINFAITHSVLFRRPMPSHFCTTMMVQS